MCDAHCRIGRIHRLPTRSARAKNVNLEVVRVYFDFFWLIHLGEHQDTSGRGVDSTLRFSDGDPLDTMNAALILHARPHAFGGISGRRLDGNLDVLKAAHIALGLVQDLGFPSPGLGVVDIHPQEVGSKEG